MTKAPLSQTLFLTEDGSKIDVIAANAVTIPPLTIYTVANVLASSTRLSQQVVGEPAIYAALYPRLSAAKALILADRDRRISLTARVVALEGGTPGTTATPTQSSDPTYDPAATVVVNAQRWSDFLDSVIALTASEESAWASLLARIEALENPPAPPTPAYVLSGPTIIAEGASPAPQYALTGPSTIVEGN